MREMDAARRDEQTLAEAAAKQIPCDERHYTRFLRKVLPGPERSEGQYVCDTCGTYFDDNGVIVTQKPQGDKP